MASEKLRYVSTRVEERLRSSVRENLTRYLETGFGDLASSEGWAIPLTVKVDLEPLKLLRADVNPESEVLNSLLMWKALSHLTPSLANEGRIWTRITHVEGYAYAKARWVGDRTGEAAIQAIEAHFFGDTRTRRRDDNAIGRLWWNAYVARQAMQNSHHDALKALLQSADIRSNIVERPWTGSRPAVAGAVLRAIIRNPAVTASEKSFREFMKAVNRNGGGVVFEIMSERAVDAFMDACVYQEAVR
jgi:hypothetical protein